MLRVREWLPDVVLLDIEMSGVSGLELAHQIPPGCCLIFTTAYAQYSIDGFDVCAVDFLHKPFFYERFNRAMQKAEQWLRMNDLLRLSESKERQLKVKSDYKTVSVSVDTILYMESIDNYVKFHLADDTSLLSKVALTASKSSCHGENFCASTGHLSWPESASNASRALKSFSPKTPNACPSAKNMRRK